MTPGRAGMVCPECGGDLHQRRTLAKDHHGVERIRVCSGCGNRYVTKEVIQRRLKK